MKGFYLKALTRSARDHGGKLLSKSSSFFFFFFDRWCKVAFSVIFIDCIECCLGRGGWGGGGFSSEQCHLQSLQYLYCFNLAKTYENGVECETEIFFHKTLWARSWAGNNSV